MAHKFLRRLKNLETPTYHQILLYGPPRSGKTTFIGSGAFDDRIAPILVLDFDQGASSLVGLPKKRISVVPCSTWDDLSEAYDFLANSEHRYKTVALDSLSRLHNYALAESARLSYEAAKKNKQRAERLTDVDTQQNDFKRALDQMRKLIFAYQTLPLNFITTAHAKAVLNAATNYGDGGGYVRVPNLYGQFAQEAVGSFNTTVYLSVERSKGNNHRSKTRRVLILQDYPEFMTGVRAPWGVQVPSRLAFRRDTGFTELIDILENIRQGEENGSEEQKSGGNERNETAEKEEGAPARSDV